jgi:hypothetical protein
MSDLDGLLKELTSLPLATVLVNRRLAAVVSAGWQAVQARLCNGQTVGAALARPQGQRKGSILLSQWVAQVHACL